MVHVALSAHAKRVGAFFSVACLFSAACLAFFKQVLWIDFSLYDVMSGIVVMFSYHHYYPRGALTRRQWFAIFAIVAPILLWEDLSSPLSPGQGAKVPRQPSGRPVLLLTPTQQMFGGISTFGTLLVVIPGLVELVYRRNQREEGQRMVYVEQVDPVELQQVRSERLASGAQAADAVGADKETLANAGTSTRTSSGWDDTVEGADARYSPFAPSQRSVSLYLGGLVCALQFCVSAVMRNWLLTNGEAAAINMGLQFLSVGVVVLESWRRPPIRRARGHLLPLSLLIGGMFLLPRTVALVQQTAESGLAQVFVFVLVISALLLAQLYIWRASILMTNVWEALPLVYVVQSVDDLMSDFLVSTNLGYDAATIGMLVALMARLILRDVGYFEDGYNWLRAKFLGDEHEARAQSFGSEKLAQEYRLYRKVLHARKYWLYASQDLLSEHLSAVVLPTLLLFDFYSGGWCIVSCDVKSEEVLWTAVSIFGVLLVLKLVANEIVWRLSKRNMEQVEVEVKLFEAEHGMLPAESPLRMWSDYDVDQTLPLVEQCDSVSKLHIKRHFWFFLSSTLLAILAAVSAGGQLDY